MSHATKAAVFAADVDRAHWHDRALWFVRSKRDKCVQQLPEWETLRERASLVKQHTASRMADYLEEFERNATASGAVVHWARDAAEHNAIVFGLLKERGIERVIKSKSMLTEECGLNPFLEGKGLEVVDTDLGEWIVQLRHEHPSHIVLPAIHIKKEEVGELFHSHLGTTAGSTDEKYLVDAARAELRNKFLAGTAGITGVNFAIAETGGIVVCTNEGNADLGASLPALHIASMGIEKLIPRLADLGVFLRVLARSATGQPITTYSSHFHGPRPNGELHIVLVDNGRTRLLASDELRRSLNCIRCGACMNTCPVYRRSGGHSYGVPVPGPIGSVLYPSRDMQLHKSLPDACSLCGSCTDVCPVKIPLHHQLLAWRKTLVKEKVTPWHMRAAMQAVGGVMARPWLFRLGGKLGRFALRWSPRWLVYNRLNPWGGQREMPPAAKQTFRQLFDGKLTTKGTKTHEGKDGRR